MPTKEQSKDYLLVKVEGYSANKKYMYARRFPDGEKLTVAVKKNVKTDFIGYLGNENDKRHAPKGSTVALFNVTHIKDSFYITNWAKTVSKKPQSEDVIVTPTTISPVIDLGNGNTQILSRLVDPIPLQTQELSQIRDTALAAIKTVPPELNLAGNRGFMLRISLNGQSGVQSASFKGLAGKTPEQMIEFYFGENGNALPPAMKSILTAAKTAATKGNAKFEVVAFTDAPVFNYGNSSNDHKLASVPNFRMPSNQKSSPTFSNAAITIDRQDNNKVLRVTPLPDKNIISDVHGLVGSHNKTTPDNTPFKLPKQFESISNEPATKDKSTFPVTITPFIDESNKQFNSIFVKVREDAPNDVHQRVINAINVEPRKGAGGYYFNKVDRKKVESALSDLAGTPALYTANGTIGGERYVFVAGRTNEPYFKAKLNALTQSYNIQAQAGGLYSIPENESLNTLAAMADLLKESATSKLSESYLASKPVTKPIKTAPRTQRLPTYTEWLDSQYAKNPELLASEFNNSIADKAAEAGIDWESSKHNIIWPSLNGEAENIGTTANVKPDNPADNGSCYISTMFNSWLTAKGNEQYGIIVTFTNLNKDREQRWSFSSHKDTYERYSNEVWGNDSGGKLPSGPSADEIAEQKRIIELENNKKRAHKIAKAEAQKKKAFNHFSALQSFSGNHKGLEQKQLTNFAAWVNAKHIDIKNEPNNKGLAFAAYDIHERFVGYQYVTEEKLLLNKEKPEKNSSWSNKLFNFGFQKDDVRTGLPLGTHRTLGEINERSPHTIFYSEGWANTGSNYALTDNPSVIGFDKDNMKKVIGLMTKKYPEHQHVHVSDNDMHSPEKGNVGVMAALDTAYHFGAKVVIPDVAQLPNAYENKYSDTSDLFTNGARDLLVAQLQNPQDLSDIVVNHLERIKYCAENKLNYNIALLAHVLDNEGVSEGDKLASINEALQLRTELYKPVNQSYSHEYAAGFTARSLASLKGVSDSDLKKVSYSAVEVSTQTNNNSNQLVNQNQTGKEQQTNQVTPEWPVSVSVTKNPNPKVGAKVANVTEITDTTGEFTDAITDKLQSLNIPFTVVNKTGKIYAPYKYINLINSGLSHFTGAPTVYAGRPRDAENSGVVMRGDFTNPTTLTDVEAALKPLGISYDEEEMGYVISDPNTFVFVKEVLIENFSKANPDVSSVLSLEIDDEQLALGSKIEKVAFSLGLPKKALAKQQLKLNQHNPQLANLNSPLIAGVYAQAEDKIKNRTELASDLAPAERVYMQQRTLLTMLSSFNLAQPSLESLYREEIEAALSILKRQMHVEVDASKKERDKTSDTPPSSESIIASEPSLTDEQNNQANDEAEKNAAELTQAILKELYDTQLPSKTTLQQQHVIFQETPSEDDLQKLLSTVNSAETDAKVESVDENVESVDENVEPTTTAEIEEPEIETQEVAAPNFPHTPVHEVRLNNLVDFVDTYLANEYTAEEVNESLSEPGSPYYDHVHGFQNQLLRDDLKKVHATPIAKQYNLQRSIESSFAFIAGIEKSIVDSRLEQLDLFINTILDNNPNFTPKRVSTYAIQGSYRGVAHPYMDEDGKYNKELLKSDLMHIDGYEDVTTLTGYFALQQEEYLDNAQNESAEFIGDEAKGVDVKNSEEDALIETQVKLMSAMPAPPASVNREAQTNEQSESIESADTTADNSTHESVEAALVEDAADKANEIDARSITVNNDNDSYTSLYALAIQCAKEEMSYEEFYEAVFTSDGVYFEENPYSKNGKLDKKSVVQDLKPNGFTSPRGFFESAFEDVQGKPQANMELTRVAGVFPTTVIANGGIGAQFNAVDTLLSTESPIALAEAQEITKQSFSRWYNDGHGSTIVAIHPIFSENLLNISATELADKYNDNEIKLLADVMCVATDNADQKDAIIAKIKTQWNERVALQGMTKEDFQELSSDDIQRIADVFNVPYTPSKADMARQVYAKTDDVKQLVSLRIAQYSYVVSALTIEREKGFVPSFVYRQLDSLLAEESNYKPVVLDQISKTELSKLNEAANDAKSILTRLSESARRKADNVEVPKSPEMVGVENADIIGLGEYKYVVTNGNAKDVPKPPHMTGFAVYGDNQILAPAAFSKEDLLKHNIEPVSRNAIMEVLSPAKSLFDKQGYIAFSTDNEKYGVIYQEKNKATLRFIGASSDDAQVYKANTFNEAFERALDLFPVSSIEFSDGFSAIMTNRDKNDVTANSIESLYNTLLDSSHSDGSCTELSKDIALDVLAKANELDIKPSNQSTDEVLQAISLVEQINERHQSSKFATLVGIDDSLSEKEQALLEHALKLSDSTVLTQIESEIPKQDTDDDLLAQLNASALRDLNTTLTLDGDAQILQDVVDAEPYLVNIDEEKAALEALKEQLTNEVAPDIELVSDTVVKSDNSAAEAAFFESQGITNDGSEVAEETTDAVRSDNVIVDGSIVTYSHDSKHLFGYVTSDPDGLKIEKYTFQDEYDRLKEQHPALFLTVNEKQEPVFAINKDDYINSVKSSGETGNQLVDKLISKAGSIKTLSVKELRILAELTGVKEPSDKFVLGSDLVPLVEDYFKVNQLGLTPLELHTDDDKEFIAKYFGDRDAPTNVVSLTEELTKQTSKRIIDKVISDANAEVEKSSVSSPIINHSNNTDTAILVSEAKNIEPVIKQELLKTLKLPEAVLSAKQPNLDGGLKALVGSTLDSLPNDTESVNVIANKGSAVYVGTEELFDSKLVNDVLDTSEEVDVIYTDNEGNDKLLSVSVNSISFDVQAIQYEAKSQFDEYIYKSLDRVVSKINDPYPLNDEAGLTYNHSRLLANQMINNYAEASLNDANIPNGYELLISQDKFHIETEDNTKRKDEFEHLGKFDDIKSLNMATLIAKRTALGDNHNDTANTLRSEPSGPSETVLPDTTQGVGDIQPTELVHPDEAGGTERNGEQDKQEIDGTIRTENKVHRERDSARSDKSTGIDGSANSDISTSGIKFKPNVNYSYEDSLINDVANHRTESETYELNLAAIKLAKELSSEKREPTLEEKNTLAQYRGWGGLSSVFDNSRLSHADKRVELQEILSLEEYASIKRSTLSAFYTSPALVGSVWNAMKHLGVKEGAGLDPAFGIGNFASAMPADMQDKISLQAKELDPLTAEIARHIHGPFVKNQGYEEAKIPANTFDFAIGNIPFGDFKVYDRNHRDLSKYQIHDYFFLKSLDKVKPGGFVAFITSSGTLDKKSSTVRNLISKQADLVGAIRLPTDAFSDNARTQVNSDILFLQKRHPEMDPSNNNWLDVGVKALPVSIHGGYEENIEMNQYFIDNPNMVIGNQHVTSTRFGGKTYRTVHDGDLIEALNEAITHLPENIHFEYEVKKEQLSPFVSSAEETTGKRLNSYHLDSDGDVALTVEKFEYNAERDEVESTQYLEKVELKKSAIGRMKSLINLRDTVKDHINLMLVSDGDNGFSESLEALNAKYDAHIKKYGFLNQHGNKSAFKADPDSSILLALEKWDKKEKVGEKADIFNERTLFPRKEITHTDSVDDAILISLSEKGSVVPEYIESLTKKEWPVIVAELGDDIFLNPQSNEWEHSSTYLSGQVIDKLELAVDAASENEIFKHNVTNLEKVIPTPIPYYEIRAKFGSSWIPPQDVSDFLKYIITGDDTPCTNQESERVFKAAKVMGGWEFGISSYQVGANSGRTKSEFGTNEWPADELLIAIANNKSIGVYAKDENGKRYMVADKTAEANAKADLIKDTFRQWLWENPDRAERLENLYNRKNNGFVEPVFDGSKIEIKGLASTLNGKEFKPRQKQLNAIMRYIVTGRALFLHDVGVGKSFALLGSIMKGKEIGRHNKAMLAVPNPVFAQMQTLAQSHFPNAKVLMIDAKALNAANRETTLAQVSTNSWDAIVISHSIATRISVPDEYKLELLEQEMSEVKNAISSLEGTGFHGKLSIKAHERKLENEKAKIYERIDSQSSYDTVNIEEMGIDAIFIDEIDEFVNLAKVTNMGHVAGVNVKESAKARSLFYLTQYMHDKFNNTGVVGATGTDIRNNIGDQFALMRYIAPDLLREQGIEMYDDFIGTFGEIQTQFEIAPEGTGFIEKTRLSKFYNLPELSMFYRQVADIVNAEDANVIRPNIIEKSETSIPSPELSLYMECLAQRAKSIRNGGSDSDNLLAITNDGRKVALDIRFLDERLPDYEDSKVNTCVKNVLEEYNNSKPLNPSQIIFSDIGVPNNAGRFDLYDDIKQKLIAGGIPDEKIVYARDFKTDAAKQELQDKMNAGDIAVTIGTTENMGVGKNVQERLVAIHDLSIPWRVRDLEQRGGRIERFGNIFEDAKRFKYSTQDSFDLFIWNKLKQKALFAAQTKRTPRDAAREFDEELNPGYSEVMATLTGNPLIEESITLESKIDKLAMLERSHHRNKASRKAEVGFIKDHIETLTSASERKKDTMALLGDYKVTLLGKPIESYEGDFTSVAKVINKGINDARKLKKRSCQFEVGDISGGSLIVDSNSPTKKLALLVESQGERKLLSEHNFAASLLKPLVNLQGNLTTSLNEIDSQINFHRTKIHSLESVNNESFSQADELTECRQRLSVIQREIAEAAEQEAAINGEKEDPVQQWQNLLDELNNRELGIDQQDEVIKLTLD